MLSLIDQGNNCQLVIVNDGSTDSTSDVIKEFSNKLDVIELSCHDQWWGGSINFGWNWLKNNKKFHDDDIIAFANNDISLPSNFINLVKKYVTDNTEALFHPQVQENGRYMSAGAEINSWLPFVTTHPKNITKELHSIELGTARFLFGSAAIFSRLDGIRKELKQYQGDNDFTLRAIKLDHPVYIVRDMIVQLNDDSTGLKSHNIKSLKELLASFSSLRSPNNIKVRYCFLRGHFNIVIATLITASMTFNAIFKFMINYLQDIFRLK